MPDLHRSLAAEMLQLHLPRRFVFGGGCVAQCTDDLVSDGFRRVFIVTAPFTLEPAERMAAAVRAAGGEAVLCSEIENEPSFGTFEGVRARARKFRPDAVAGLGGGSVLDVAKLVAALHDREEPARTLAGIGVLRARRTPLVCLPTTAGTGSEMSPNAILLDEAQNLKLGIISRCLVPDSAYIDPDLTLSVPPAVTAATGLDALVHCIEAYANKYAHPIVDLYALEGVRLIGGSLVRAVRDGADREARANLALGSCYGGVCLGPVNTAAVHALAYPLGGEFHVAHGVSNALLLTAVLKFNLPASPKRYAAVARALGAAAGADDSETALAGLGILERLCAECGVPRRLSQVGVSDEAVPRMAKSAMSVARLLRNNPRELTAADAEAIYRSVL